MKKQIENLLEVVRDAARDRDGKRITSEEERRHCQVFRERSPDAGRLRTGPKQVYSRNCQSCVRGERRERKSGGRVGLVRGVYGWWMKVGEREIKEMEEEEEEED